MAEIYKQILENEEKLNEITRVAFDNVNTNKSGEIDEEQLHSMINQICSDLSNELPTDKEMAEIFDYLDSKKKGTLSFDDFKILIKDVINSMVEELSV